MDAPEKSKASSSSTQRVRVKVFRLNEEAEWDEQGSGHVTLNYLEGSKELGLFVIDEKDSETLIMHRISSNDRYRKQGDTVITWSCPEYSTEVALGFQLATGCSFIWDNICNIQGKLQFSTLSNKKLHSVNSELKELPAVELSTLHLILKIVVESGIADDMRLIVLLLNDREFFRKLMNLFRICEDLENTGSLHMIFKIVRGIVLLNDPRIFEKIFSDELIMDIIGSLEYDPEVPHTRQFRNFLKEHVVLKEAIRIKSPVVLSKIHQTHRVGYLKDVVLARMLDDSMEVNLDSIIDANHAIIVSFLKDDSDFIQELFTRLRSPSTPDDSKRDLVCFLYEFCCLSKRLQVVLLELRFFRDLMNEGIFDTITAVLQSSDKKLVLIGADILVLFMNHDKNLLRTHVVQKGLSLFGLLVKGMVTDFGDNMHCQFFEILGHLLNTTGLSEVQRDAIIEIFYGKHLEQLIDIITASCPTGGLQSAKNIEGAGRKLEGLNGVKPEILSTICEFLCFCVVQHPYRIKSNFLLNNMIDKVMLLTRRKENYLVACAVRFIRTVLSYHDEHMLNYFVENNTLKPIIDAFVANGYRYNLLNSAILDLFGYIRKKNLKVLVRYIIDSFWNQLSPFENFLSIQALQAKYQKYLENEEDEEQDVLDSGEGDTAPPVASIQNVESQPAISDDIATNYPLVSLRSGGLVDYDNDDDDVDENNEDYRPPQSEQPDTSGVDIDVMEGLGNKRKSAAQEEPEMVKKQRLDRKHNPNDGVLASSCTTPSLATTSATETSPCTSNENKSSVEENHETNPAISSSRSSDSSSSALHITSENRQLGGDDYPLVLPKPSPEKTVNGSSS